MIIKALSAFIATLIILTGCATSPAAPPAATTQPKAQTEAPKTTTEQAKPAAKPAGPTGTLNAAVAGFGDDRLEPILSSSAPITAQIFETMLVVDTKGKVVPRLAESWSVSPDGKIWTFKMRKGVKFHNGDEVTSADAKFSMERLLSPKSRSGWSPGYRLAVDRVEAPDPSTVVVYIKQPEATWVLQAAGWTVMPKKYTEEKGDDFVAENPVGTGPWKFVKRTPGANVEYDAVKDHYRVVPAFEKLVIKLVPEESTRMAMLKRGEIDVTEVSLDAADEAKAAGLELRFDPIERSPVITFKATWLDTGQPTQDIKVRQALSLAINREELAKTYFKGFATPGGRIWMAPYSWAWDPKWGVDPYDPAKAKQLLAEAGYPNKFKDPVITVWTHRQPGAAWLGPMMEAISGYWEAIGVKTKLQAMDYATLYGKFFYKPPDPAIVGTAYSWATTGNSNATYFINSVYASTSFWDILNSPEWDGSWLKVLAEQDETKRMDLYRQAMTIAHDQYVDINTVNVKNAYAVSKQIGEWKDVTGGLASFYEGIQHK
jgi:peptide/nickel transport system substrate-binding protein